MVRTWLGVVALSMLSGLAAAQTCNTLARGSNCAAPPTRGGPIDFSKPNYDPDPRDARGANFLTPFSGTSTFGSELSGNYAPATIGAITFGGGRPRCGGLFRSGSC